MFVFNGEGVYFGLSLGFVHAAKHALFYVIIPLSPRPALPCQTSCLIAEANVSAGIVSFPAANKTLLILGSFMLSDTCTLVSPAGFCV